MNAIVQNSGRSGKLSPKHGSKSLVYAGDRIAQRANTYDLGTELNAPLSKIIARFSAYFLCLAKTSRQPASMARKFIRIDSGSDTVDTGISAHTLWPTSRTLKHGNRAFVVTRRADVLGGSWGACAQPLVATHRADIVASLALGGLRVTRSAEHIVQGQSLGLDR